MKILGDNMGKFIDLINQKKEGASNFVSLVNQETETPFSYPKGKYLLEKGLYDYQNRQVKKASFGLDQNVQTTKAPSILETKTSSSGVGIKELPSVRDVVGGAGSLFKAVIQAPFKVAAAVGLEPVKAAAKDTDYEAKFVPETGLEKFLFGEEPIKPLTTQYNKATKSLESGLGLDPTLSKMLATTAIFGGAILDVTWGGGKKKIVKELTEAYSDDAVRVILKNANVTDDLIKQYTKRIVKETDPKKVSKMLSNIVRTQKAMRSIAKETDPLKKLIMAIDEAVPLRAEQKQLYKKELARRTARVSAVGKKVGGEAGFYAQLGQLKGELPKRAFESVKKQFTQKDLNLLFDSIENTKTLLPLEKVSTKQALANLLDGAVPTPGQIENLKEAFSSELVDSLLARRPFFEKAKDVGVDLLNINKTMMATADVSASFRQGLFMLGRPKQFFSAFKNQFKYLASEKSYQGLVDDIKLRPTYLKMKQAGLNITDIGGKISKREERFASNLAQKIPLFGSLVRASDRAYTGFLNKLRADLFDDLLSKAIRSGEEIDDNFLKSLGDYINAGTGRGKFGVKETLIIPKAMERVAPTLNGVLFSPKLMASRLNLINPIFYVQLDPFVRKEALKTLFTDAAIFTSIYGLWKMNGGEVGVDPRSADFGKLKIGNTRYDVLGGFQQYIRMAAQLVSGEVVSSTTGRTTTLGEGYKPLTRSEILLRFFEYKTSPIASFVIGLLKGQTAVGEDFDVPAEVINRFTPMVVQDIYDLTQERGAEGVLYSLPAIFGVGVQTYGKQELVSGETQLGKKTMQVRPVQGLGEKVRELVFGQVPLGSSRGFSVEAYVDQLNNLPSDEAADIFDKIIQGNPDLADKIKDVVKERQKGITAKDKDLKAKGVASGDRALAVKEELDKLETDEEKAKLWDEYVYKGIITKEVSRQLKNLIK